MTGTLTAEQVKHFCREGYLSLEYVLGNENLPLQSSTLCVPALLFQLLNSYL